MTETRAPRFLCEACGSEVPRDAKICPHCGKFFASVRCPICHFAGSAARFSQGCPKCGYSFAPEQKRGDPARQSKRKRSAGADPLPRWIYALVGVLAVVVSALLAAAVRRGL